VFPAEGAQVAASTIRRIFSRGTGSLWNFRMLCRPFMALKTSILFGSSSLKNLSTGHPIPGARRGGRIRE